MPFPAVPPKSHSGIKAQLASHLLLEVKPSGAEFFSLFLGFHHMVSVLLSALRHWLSLGPSICLAQDREDFEGESVLTPPGFLSRVESCVWRGEDTKHYLGGWEGRVVGRLTC